MAGGERGVVHTGRAVHGASSDCCALGSRKGAATRLPVGSHHRASGEYCSRRSRRLLRRAHTQLPGTAPLFALQPPHVTPRPRGSMDSSFPEPLGSLGNRRA